MIYGHTDISYSYYLCITVGIVSYCCLSLTTRICKRHFFLPLFVSFFFFVNEKVAQKYSRNRPHTSSYMIKYVLSV